LIEILKENLDNIVVFFSIAVGVIYAIYWFKVKGEKAYTYLTAYLVLTTIINLIMTYYAINKWNNLFLSHFYFMIQFIFLSQFYYELFKKEQLRFVRYVQLLVLIILTCNFIIEPLIFFRFSLLEVFLTSFSLFLFSVVHLYNSLVKKGKYLFFNAGILIYSSISTLIFFLGNYLSLGSTDMSRDIKLNIWNINVLITLVYQVLIFLEWKTNISKWKLKNP